jgi:hypothetical protein
MEMEISDMKKRSGGGRLSSELAVASLARAWQVMRRLGE